MERIILDLCGGKGSWSKPYSDSKDDPKCRISYDVLNVEAKIGGDVRLLERIDRLVPYVHGILAAPPCTKFTVSGNRWKKSDKDYKEALAIVDACLRLVYAYTPKWWALENPVGTLHRWIGKPVMYFNPCDYGDPYTKKTCLWGDFNIPKKNPVEPIKAKKGSHSQDKYFQSIGKKIDIKNRAEIRSITPPGFAKAFFEANP